MIHLIHPVRTQDHMTHVIMVVIISDPVVATENRRLKDQLTKLEAEVKSEWHVLCISHSSTM